MSIYADNTWKMRQRGVLCLMERWEYRRVGRRMNQWSKRRFHMLDVKLLMTADAMVENKSMKAQAGRSDHGIMLRNWSSTQQNNTKGETLQDRSAHDRE